MGIVKEAIRSGKIKDGINVNSRKCINIFVEEAEDRNLSAVAHQAVSLFQQL